jgi:hypothetical protein
MAVSVTVTVNGQVDGGQTFSYTAPAVTSVTPSAASTVGGATLTLAGSSFGLSGSITVGGPVVADVVAHLRALHAAARRRPGIDRRQFSLTPRR